MMTNSARHFIRHGIPCVCFGPRGEDIHAIDERVSLRSMHECAEVLARFALAWCGGVADSGTALGEADPQGEEHHHVHR